MSLATALLLLAKVTIAAAVGLAAVQLARRSRAAVRHVVLTATFAGVIALPLVALVAPAISITVPIAGSAQPAVPAVELRVDRSTEAPVLTSAGAPDAAPETSAAARSWRSVLVIIWMAGAAVCVLPLAIGLWQMRGLRRTGLPCLPAQAIADAVGRDAGITRRIDVRVHASTPGPLTFGVIRPAIMLPPDARAWSDDDLRRAVIHELEHIRRHDWLTQCLARLACAGYWCHPLIWVVWRRFALEAERACDDAVLRRSDAAAYADQLVGLAKRLSLAARQPLLAMASRADLSMRVGAVLDERQPRGRAGRRSIVAVALAAMALVLVVSPLRLVAAVQSAAPATTSQAKQRYDAATVKPCVAEAQPTGARGTYGGTNASFSPGRFNVPCVTTGQLIYLAHAAGGVDPADRLINDDPGTAASPQKVRGGPDWVHSLREKYVVEASAAGVTDRTVLMGAMLRTLLEERFKLTLHRETEQVDMYAMTVAKGGLKVKPLREGDCIPYDGSAPSPDNPKPTCGNLSMQSANGLTRWVFGGTTFDRFAKSVARAAGAPIVDRTNISGEFIVRLEWRHDDVQSGDATLRDPVTGRDLTERLKNAPPLATALEEQVGVKLEKIKGPRGYLVIDHIERPTPDAPTTPPMRAAGAGGR